MTSAKICDVSELLVPYTVYVRTTFAVDRVQSYLEDGKEQGVPVLLVEIRRPLKFLRLIELVIHASDLYCVRRAEKPSRREGGTSRAHRVLDGEPRELPKRPLHFTLNEGVYSLLGGVSDVQGAHTVS